MIFIIIWIVDSFHHQNNCELIHGFDKMIIAILDSKIFFYRFPQVKKRHGKKVYPGSSAKVIDVARKNPH